LETSGRKIKGGPRLYGKVLTQVNRGEDEFLPSPMKKEVIL
jgi:hypothetical protein